MHDIHPEAIYDKSLFATTSHKSLFFLKQVSIKVWFGSGI